MSDAPKNELNERGSLTKEIKYHDGPPYNGSTLSLITFWPATSLVAKGRKREIKRSDIWKLNKDFAAEHVWSAFEKHWNEELDRKRPSLFRALRKTFGIHALKGVFLMILQVILSFTMPVLLPYIIQYLYASPNSDIIKSLPNTSPLPEWWGYIYIVSVFLAGAVGSCCFYHSYLISWGFGLKIRASLVTLIYRKALYISKGPNESSGTIVNLMSSDAQIFLDTFVFFVQGMVAPLQILICTALLWFQIGPYSFIPLGVLLISLPISSYLSKKVGYYKGKIQVSTDNRIKLVKELITAIRIVKYYAWEKPFRKNIKEARKRELKLYKKLHLNRAFMLFILLNVPGLGIGFTFFFYGLTNELTIIKTFTSMSLLNTLRSPFFFFPLMLSMIGQYSVSLDRIQKFALRENLPKAPMGNHPEGKKGLYIKDGNFTWETYDQAKERIINEELQDLEDKKKKSKLKDKEFMKSIVVDRRLTLKDINMKVRDGEFVCVVGGVGSGKSSLGLAFLGEIHKVSGETYVSSPIAYASQEPWILNATVRDNIIFGKPFDRKFYNHIIEACALKPDLMSFTAGDMTEIGERGVNLSGGQKQRINIARAMYSDRDIYIFDDPFSSVDAHVGNHLFHNVIMHLKARGKTILLITNQLQFLPYSDRIVLIKNGKIKEQGTFKELMDKKKEFYNLANEFGVNEYTDEDSESSESQDEDTEMEKYDSNDGTFIEAERTEKGNMGFSTYFYYIKSGKLSIFSIIIISFILKSASSIGSTIWLSRWANPETSNLFTHTQYIGGYIGFVLAEAFFNLIISLTFVSFIINASKHIHEKLVKSISRAKTSFYDRTPIGRLLTRFSRDIGFVDILLPQQFENTLDMMFTLITILAGVAVGAPYIVIVVVVAMILYIMLLSIFRKTSIQVQRLESLSRAPLFTHFSETIEGAITIRAYQIEKAFMTSNLSMVDANSVDYFGLRVTNQWFGLRLSFLGHFINLFAFLTIVLMRNYTNSLDVGFASLALSYTNGVIVMLGILSTSIAELEVRVNSIERLKEYGNIDEEAPEHIPDKLPSEPWPSRGEIQFKNLTVEYTSDTPVLKNISATIKPKEKIGIIGRTGAGKSTLITALFRTIEPRSGKIYIDGVNILKLGLTDLRSKLSIIPQISQMFIGTLRYNLDPFNEHDDHELWRVLEMVKLKKKVESLGGLNTTVEENGQNFSPGERQLIAMARCLLRNTPILLLDEATAAVDVKTDALLQKMIRTNFVDKTVLTIAHRLNTIMDSDRIMVLDKGEIVEFDKPSVLLTNPNGVLYNMVEATGPITSKFLRRIAEGKMTVEEAILEESLSEE